MSETAQAAPAASEASSENASTQNTASEEIKADYETSESEEGIEAAEGQEGQEELTKEEKKEIARKKKYQLKVNGKSKDVELDLDNDVEIQKYLQKAMAADEKFQEAAYLRKNVETLINELRSNPLAILKHPELGINVKELAERVLNEELEEMSKTPEQKRLEDMERKLKEYEEEKKRLEEEKLMEQQARLEEMANQQLDDQISGALAKSNLPKSTYTIKRIADTMIEAVNAGYVDVTVDEIMPIVEQRLKSELQEMFQASPDDVFEQLVDKKRLDAYRKARVQKVKSKPVVTAKQIQDTGESSKTQKKQEPNELRIKDLFKLT